MIEYILYLILVMPTGETHIVKHEGLSNVVCQVYLKNLNAYVEESDTEQFKTVKTGCLKRKLTKVRI